MRLAHLHLPNLTPYIQASHLQSKLVSRLLAHKAASASNNDTTTTTTNPPPDPVILTAQFHPVYTCGRREIGHLSPSQISHLRAGGQAEFHEALRGGQTTYHGPGQLVAYPILDLRRHGLTPRAYVRLLESTVIGVCAEYGVHAFTTCNPGVWTSEESKVCAVGVHLRRNVSSHGVGFNVHPDVLPWFERIVACGLEGKRASCLEVLLGRRVEVDEVGRRFVRDLAEGLQGVDEIYDLDERDVLEMP